MQADPVPDTHFAHVVTTHYPVGVIYLTVDKRFIAIGFTGSDLHAKTDPGGIP